MGRDGEDLEDWGHRSGPVASGSPLAFLLLLGLANGSHQDLRRPTAYDIRRAFQRLASRYHPDRASGDAAVMAELNQARDDALKEIA